MLNLKDMKRIISLSILVFLLALPALSQSMKFMDIPLGINISSFKQKLLNKGFKFDSKNTESDEFHGMYIFDGRFAGQLVGLSVCVSPKTKSVYSVCVRFKNLAYSEYGNGISLKDQDFEYNKLFDNISQKYGMPTYNRVKLSDQIPIATLWETSEGTIDLSVRWYYHYRSLDLIYTDNKANKINEKEKQSDL